MRRRVGSIADTALIVGAVGAHVALLAVLQLVPGTTRDMRHVVQLCASVVSYALLALAAWRVSTDARVDEESRDAWRLLSLAVVTQWVFYAAYFVVESGWGAPPPLSWLDAIYLLSYPLLLAGILRLPQPSRAGFRVATHWIDAALVIVAGGVAIVHFALPDGAVLERMPGRALATLLVYPAGDVVLLLGATTLWMREPAMRRHGTALLLTLALVAMMGADVTYSSRMAHGRYHVGSWLDVAWTIPVALMAMAAHWQRVMARRVYAHGEPSAIRTRPAGLPYVATAFVYLLAIGYRAFTGTTAPRVLAVGAVVVTVLVLLRQWLALNENARLVGAAAARESEARFRALVQHASEMLLIVDGDFTVTYASPAAVKALAMRTEDVVGARLLSLVEKDDVPAAVRLLGRAVAAGRESVRGEWRLRASDERVVLAEHVATCLLDEPAVRGIVLNSRDVTERSELEQKLTHQALHDPLTQLANRTLFQDRLDHACRRAARAPGSVALLFLDLDDFKRINDSLGHAAGDALLVETGARVASQLRDGDTLARLGGDEFAILLEGVEDVEMPTSVAARVLSALRDPITIAGKEIHVCVSIGIATTRDAVTPVELMRNADLAMYLAKSRGKDGCAAYEPHMYEAMAMRLDVEADLRRAIDAGELRLVFQPVIRLRDRQVVGAEALVRWTHPVRGEISPSTFIPIAEEAGLIVPIERWVLHEACRHARRWHDEEGVPIVVGVNISARHIHDPSLLGDVRDALAASDLSPDQLALEITESVLLRDSADVARVLGDLKRLGVRLALDDFGTGYSSLSYLQRFPIDMLKIDKAFVAPMAAASFDARLVRAIIALGESLGMLIVAEGIETEVQRRALCELGCAVGQGFLFSRPLESGALVALVRRLGVAAPELHLPVAARALEAADR
ncbi:MAG: EAL domain-containing protein [Gemmatimonadaceae bacterium]|nr:EAL domain-containing protein [Gemmatimonadaceae bacterium]